MDKITVSSHPWNFPANRINLWFAILLVAVPALIHALFRGSYVVDPDGYRRTFWIGPISTTIPFVFLALLFLAHCQRYKRSGSVSATFPKSAYWGSAMAWLAMIAFTLFVASQPPGPKVSSTMAIAVVMTPFFYVPLLLFPYAFGTIVGRFWSKWTMG
jgi:hypothetical protein